VTQGPGAIPSHSDHPSFEYAVQAARQHMAGLARQAKQLEVAIDILCAGTCPVHVPLVHPLAEGSGGVLLLLADGFQATFAENVRRALLRGAGSRGSLAVRCSPPLQLARVIGPAEAPTEPLEQAGPNGEATRRGRRAGGGPGSGERERHGRKEARTLVGFFSCLARDRRAAAGRRFPPSLRVPDPLFVRCADRASWFHLSTVERQHGLALFLQLAEDITDDWAYFQVAVHYTNTQQSRSVRVPSGTGRRNCSCKVCRSVSLYPLWIRGDLGGDLKNWSEQLCVSSIRLFSSTHEA
jgi:hypothetical protein